MTELKSRELSTVVAAGGVVLIVLAAFTLGLVVGAQIGGPSEPGAVTTLREQIDEEMMTESPMDGGGGRCGPGEDGPMVCLESVSVDDGFLTFTLSYVGFSPSIGSGIHAHIYPGSQEPAGVGSGGIWQVVDQPVWEVSITGPLAPG